MSREEKGTPARAKNLDGWDVAERRCGSSFASLVSSVR